MISLKEANVINFENDELADIVSLLRLVNTFWLSFYQTQNNNVEINEAVFYEGVLKILVIIRPYTTEIGLPELMKAREMYMKKCEESLEIT